MRPEEKDLAYIWDMLDAAQAIQEFAEGKTFHHYLNQRMLRGAVERHLEIIGEAANRVSKEFKDTHPEIPWHRIIAQRHVIAHEYGEIKQELIWKVVVIHIPELINNLEKIIPSLH
ncbi:MAG: HepT-like ribonuclease domain-containing protein [Desulfobaccales bacterium]